MKSIVGQRVHTNKNGKPCCEYADMVLYNDNVIMIDIIKQNRAYMENV